MPTTDPEPASSSATPSSRASSRSPARSCRPRSRPSSPARPPDGRTVLDREVVAGPTLEAAKALLGAWLVRDPDPIDRRAAVSGAASEPRIGRIVEVEAYIGEGDRASHARFGRTDRTRVMFGPPGIAYVYLVYGMYDCLNIVTEPAGSPAAVLVRAVEPATGIDEMRAARLAIVARRRTRDAATLERERARLERLPVERLATGPGLVAAAFSIDRTLTGVDLCDAASPLRIEIGSEPRPRIVEGPRVGVGYAGPEWASKAWRFAIAQSPSVSSPPIR